LDLDLYASLLERHGVRTEDVAGTRVDYASLKRSASWRKLVYQLRRVRPETLPSREARLAFWINAYNILAIETVVESYPVESIRDVGSFLRPVWRRPAGRVGGASVTLHHIEHEVLRKMDEPRIHAAIVCASTSCPSLLLEPYRPATLEEQLERVTRRFVRNPEKGVRLEREDERVVLSKIFDWFEGDFERAAGSVLAFVRPYLPDADAAWLAEHADRLEIDYLDYDWSLNDGSDPRVAGRQPSD